MNPIRNQFSIPALCLCLGALFAATFTAQAADPTSYSTDFDSMNPGSIYGQEGWVNLGGGTYTQSVITNPATAYSGDQSWLVSNNTNNGVYRAIGTPTIAKVGESQTVYDTPAYNQFTESFWFRSVSPTADSALSISQSLGTAASVRNTWIGFSDVGGSLAVEAQGYSPVTHDFTEDVFSLPLSWGTWYHVVETATFVDGPANDTVHYQVFDTLGNVKMDQTLDSWETYYSDLGNNAEQAPGPIASNQISWKLNANPAAQGLYIDDFSMSVSEVPEASTWTIGALAVLTLGASALRRRKAVA